MRYLLTFLSLVFVFCACKKSAPNTQCNIPTIIPFQPFSNPVWHPNGYVLGFNHLPLAGISLQGTSPCTWVINNPKPDSAGFYIMNKDLSGFKRVTNYYLSAPAWSPDGKWLAFSIGSNIYKMPFNGNQFDTSKLVQLTVSNGNFNPSWTAGSDSIIFESNNTVAGGTGFYSIWKMASDGSSKVNLVAPSASGDSRQPYIGSDSRIYFINYVLGQPEVFSVDQGGLSKTQVTFNSANLQRRSPKYFQGNVFFQDNGLSFTPVGVYSPRLIAKSIDSYSISSVGEVVYANTQFGIQDKMFGTLWIMSADGSNNHQLTFNHY